MDDKIRSIPRPMVQTNQIVIVLSVLATMITGMEAILLVPLLAGISGIFFGYNPIMQAAKQFLKKPLKSYIPEDMEQQQFNQKIAVFCLGAGFLSFTFGWSIVGYIFTIMVGLAATIALAGFCIGCFIHFQWNQYKHRRAKRKAA